MMPTQDTHCGYKQVYQPVCTRPAPCPVHSHQTCTKCQGWATHDCPETVMGFFCCEPLCDACRHDTPARR